MPIVSKSIVKQNQQASGLWRIRERHLDDAGRAYHFQYLDTSVAAATIRMNARDLTEILRERERAEVLEWALAGNDPETFVRQDLTIVGVRRAVLRYFVTHRGHENCVIAAYVAGLPMAQVKAALSTTTARANRIIARAVNLRDNVCPAIVLDDTDAALDEELG